MFCWFFLSFSPSIVSSLLSNLGPPRAIPMAPTGAVSNIDNTAMVRTSSARGIAAKTLFFVARPKAIGPRVAFNKKISHQLAYVEPKKKILITHNFDKYYILTCTVAFGSQARFTKIISFIFRLAPISMMQHVIKRICTIILNIFINLPK